MMNRLPAIFFTSLLILQNVSAQVSSLDRYHPKEIIEKKQIDTCKIFAFYNKDSVIINEQITYDIYGNETSDIQLSDKYTFVYRHDSSGHLIGQDFIPFGQPVAERDTFIYDTNGNLISEITFSGGKQNSRIDYTYKNNQTVREYYYLQGKLHVSSVYIYESDTLRGVYKTFRGVPQDNYLYDYDSAGNIFQFVIVNQSGDTTLRQVFTYDKNKRMTKFEAFGAAGSLDQVYVTNYDVDGLIESEEWFQNIQNGDISKSEYSLFIYRYTYRKS